MFNLENKITWKELAPSLQAMFKTLQSQITDVKNEVNNINISLGDINDHLTKIDNDITNLNNNITTIIKDTVEDMAGEMMFLNLAPKIGYYQEDKIEVISDKIEVISKYNMNNGLGGVIIVHSYDGNEIMYFKANDGSREVWNSNKVQVYVFKAIRTSIETPFTFYNEYIEFSNIPYSKYRNVAFRSAGDNFILVAANYSTTLNDSTYTDGWYDDTDFFYIETNQSNEVSSYKTTNITNLLLTDAAVCSQFWGTDPQRARYTNRFLATSNSYWYYNSNNGILLVFGFKTDSTQFNREEVKNGKYWGVFQYNLKTNKYLRFITLGNMTDYITCKNGLSFSSTTQTTDPSTTDLNKMDEGWERPKYLYFPEQQVLRVTHREKTINYYENRIKKYININLTLVYEVPVSIWNGGNGTIIHHSLKEFGPGMDNPNYGVLFDNYYGISNYRNEYIPCFNENNGYIYFTGAYSLSNFRNSGLSLQGHIVKPSEQNTDSRGWLWYGTKVFKNLDAGSMISPDASLWGKSIIQATSFVNGKMLFFTQSKNTNYDPTNNSTALGNYLLVNINDIKVEQSDSIKVATLPNTNLIEYKSVIMRQDTMSDTDVKGISSFSSYLTSVASNNPEFYDNRKYTCDISGGNNTNVITLNNLKLNYSGSLDTGFTDGTVDNRTFNFTGGFDTNPQVNNMSLCSYKYNPFDKWYIILFQCKNYSHSEANKTYFAVLDKNNTIHKFGSSFVSKYSNDYRNIWNQAANSSETYIFNWFDCIAVDRRTMFIHLQYNISSKNNTYGHYGCIIKFNEDFSDFTMTNADQYPNLNTSDQNNIGMVYSGDKLGIVCAENEWRTFPLKIYTQKPLPNDSNGTEYEVLDMLGNFTHSNCYYMYLQSSQGLVAYIPSIPIFLGGYFSIIENPIPVTDSANMISVEYYRINTGYNDYSFS